MVQPGNQVEEAAAESIQQRTKRRLEGLRELPSSAAALQRALVMLDEPLCTNRRLEMVLTSDQGALTGLLRLANSAYFGVSGEVVCAATAIRVIGHRRLRALLCHMVAGKLFEVLRMDHPIVDAVRRKAMAAAVACGEIGLATDEGFELRVAGLLHNVGELALASEYPDELEQTKDVEATFGIRWESAGAMLLQAWRMPKPIVRAAKSWRVAPYEEDLPEAQRTVDAVHAGATMAEAWIGGDTAISAAARVHEDAIERLELTEKRLTQIFGKIPIGIHNLERML